MRILTVVVAILLIIAHASAITISEKKVEILLNEDNTADWTVWLTYPQPVKISDVFILTEVSDVEVFTGERKLECEVKKETLGTSIICEGVNSNEIVYRFKTRGVVSKKNGIDIFTYSFPIPNIIEKFYVTVKLPVGMVLVEKSKLEQWGLSPFSPSNGREGSDGRRIFVSWIFEKPELGKSIEVSVIYERPEFVVGISPNILLFLIVGIVVVSFVIFHLSRKKEIERVLPILDKSEREVMKIVIREKKNVSQKRIVKELGYSKAKISRIVKNLEKRGLIKVERRGRNNIISLKERT